MLLAPAFLLGLLAIGLPLWLHRFARRTQDRRPFASLMLLEASEVHRSQRHTLRYLMLLALRIGLLAVLALAFAEPVLPTRDPPSGAGSATLHVIALDTSLSMQQGKRWQAAVAHAERLIDALGPDDQGMLVTADHRIRIVHGPVRGGAAEELRAALRSIEPGLGRLDYGVLMTGSETWTSSADGLPTRLHLITDLQQSASPLRFADLEPPPGVELQIVDVGAGEAENWSIAGIEPAEHDANTLEVYARTGPSKGERLRVTESRDVILSIDGKERARKRIQATQAGEVRVTFPGLEIAEGDHRVTAALDPRDSLPQDDEFFAVLKRTQPRVLILAARDSGDDAAYLAAAVGALTNPPLTVERAVPDSMGERSLADYAAVIVSDAGILSAELADALERYLGAGGAALLTLGPRAAALDVIPVSGHEIETGGLAAQTRRNAPGRVSVVEESHPILRDAQGWRSIRFFRNVPIEPRQHDAVLIRFERGSPLLVEQRFGAGRLLVLTSPLNRNWNDLAIHPLFVKFIAEATRYLTGAGAGATSATAGSVVTASLTGRMGAQVYDPHGKRVLRLGDTAGMARLVPDQLGFYEVRGGERVEWIAVNVDPRESDLTRMPPDSVRKWRALGAAARSARDTPGTEADALRLLPLWPLLLLAAATLAFLEPLMANFHLYVRRGAAS